jgi:hypothetical protein
MDRRGPVLPSRTVEQRRTSLTKRSIGKWPSVKLAWDISPDNWHLSMDDYPSAEALFERFPDIRLAWVDMGDLKSALGPTWRRSSPAAAAYSYRSARLVVHLQDGGLVSPPFVQPISGRLEVNGGNHRIGWALHMEEPKLPILLLQRHEARARCLMPSLTLT